MGIAVNMPLEALSLHALFQRLGVETSIRLPARAGAAGRPGGARAGLCAAHRRLFRAGLHAAGGRGPGADRHPRDPGGHGRHRAAPALPALALGCASWSSGQLEREIRDNIWLACDPDEALIFDDDHDTKWERALAKIGVRAEQLSMQAGRA